MTQEPHTGLSVRPFGPPIPSVQGPCGDEHIRPQKQTLRSAPSLCERVRASKLHKTLYRPSVVAWPGPARCVDCGVGARILSKKGGRQRCVGVGVFAFGSRVSKVCIWCFSEAIGLVASNLLRIGALVGFVKSRLGFAVGVVGGGRWWS